MKGLWQRWCDFWFGQVDLLPISVFRFLFSFVLLIMYSIRFFEFPTFFGEEGLMSQDSLNSYLIDFLKPLFPLYTSSDSFNFALYALFLLLIFILLIGLANRWVTMIIFVLHLVFIQRNPAIIYGADLVSTFWLFYLCFVNHNQFFTIKKFLPFLKQKQVLQSDMFTSMGFRLIQIQLCIMYGYTGMEKLKGGTWWEGSAVWYVMGNDNLVPFDLSFFQHMPWAIAFMTYSTLIFEIYFPIAIWLKPLKPTWLFLGLCLHTLAAFFMGLIFFSPIMLSAYILFLNPGLIRKALGNLRWPQQVLRFISI